MAKIFLHSSEQDAEDFIRKNIEPDTSEGQDIICPCCHNVAFRTKETLATPDTTVQTDDLRSDELVHCMFCGSHPVQIFILGNPFPCSMQTAWNCIEWIPYLPVSNHEKV